LPWNVVSPLLAATIVDVAFNPSSGELLLGNSGTGLIYRINPATGATVGSFAIPVQNSGNLGLDIAPVGFTLRDTASATNVPIAAGSLIVFNGAPNPDRIIAMNPTTGAILATLTLANNFDIVGGAVTATGRVFVLDPTANSVREINPLTGAEIVAAGFAAGMDINFGDIAVHPTTGNLWIASSQTAILREYTEAGVFVRSIDLTPQGVATELSGLAFRANGGDFDLLAASNRGVIYIAPDPLVNMPQVSGMPESTVTVPVNIDRATQVQSLDLQIRYDTALLDVEESGVHLGALIVDGNLSVNVDDAAGMISIAVDLPAALGPGSGSLLEIDYKIAATAQPGPTRIDLQQVVLNDGALILTIDPVAGDDPTDGLLTIIPAAGSSRGAAAQAKALSDASLQDAADVSRRRASNWSGDEETEGNANDSWEQWRRKDALLSKGLGQKPKGSGFPSWTFEQQVTVDQSASSRLSKSTGREWLFVKA
jgi:hypothetical protein